MASTLCTNPLQCSALHEMNTHMAEINSKLTSVFATLQMFFDSWKRSSKSDNDVIVEHESPNPFQISVNSRPKQPVQASRTFPPRSPVPPYVHPPSYQNPPIWSPPTVRSKSPMLRPVQTKSPAARPILSNSPALRPFPSQSSTFVEQSTVANSNERNSDGSGKAIETIFIKEEDDEIQAKEEEIISTNISAFDQNRWQNEPVFNCSGPSTSADDNRKRRRLSGEIEENSLSSWDVAGTSNDFNLSWNSDVGEPFQVEESTSREYSFPPDVIEKAAEQADKAPTLEQRIKKFAWQLVVRTIPVGHMWDLMGAVTCSSRDASTATDLLAKQKEPVRTILQLTLQRYNIDEAHVGQAALSLTRATVRRLQKNLSRMPKPTSQPLT